MDFMWAGDIPNNRKHSSYLPTANTTHMSENSAHARLNLTPPVVRRSRADTMPSTSPFNLYSPLNVVAQQRPDRSSLTNDLLFHSAMSSPLDENASDSIASTLASLGLNTTEDHDTHHHHHLQQQQQQQQEHVQRREYFEPRNPSNNNNNHEMMSFSPFHTITKRPRAISLGMVDSSAFSPFDMPFQHQPQEPSPPVIGKEKEYPSRLLFSRMDAHEEEEVDFGTPEDDTDTDTQTPSRALWLGNINPSLSVPDLHKMFGRYGRVESARILSDKECAFVNFESVESALAAKEDLVNRLGCMVAGSVVKVGFGKADVNVAMALTNEAGPNAQGPTRALWVGNIPANINPSVLRSLFQSFGVIESIRILSHKNCGFVNFERQEDAVRARKSLQNKEILGLGSGTVRIGFAKAPTNNPDEVIQDVVISGNTITSYPTPNTIAAAAAASHHVSTMHTQPVVAEQEETTQWATVIMMASMMMNASQQKDGSPVPSPSSSTTSSSTNRRLATERKLIMQQLGYTSKDEVERIPITYFSTIPPVPEFGTERMLGPLRLREIRKLLDNGQGIHEHIAQECMDEIVELCSDYIGNTVVQKLFEFCSEETKLVMIEKIAPYLASIGIHKNGTWAAQKMIDTATTEDQIRLICTNIAPYVPLLLLDQFGNYVVQCCLRMGPVRNGYIFDAIVHKCWEIGQGRFGARAVRAILENPIVTKDQQIYVAAAIMQNALLLTTNANGSILLNWLLDTSGLLGHFRALCNTNN
ncbi:uncharacterized protein EV154DRAFT_453533 [Mucor mucedo]|uniref:uncharacterized protein n=1 Tax=Mucor mucedo TaxID=29922 RepID=UPI002220BDCB|nr:uncharacterized protein EV154DRAFT_453533 [Mucor mucedo]KAI7868827.1 hypothetical protein EV154DRAFT_453533 [Mucor mucedo]